VPPCAAVGLISQDTKFVASIAYVIASPALCLSWRAFGAFHFHIASNYQYRTPSGGTRDLLNILDTISKAGAPLTGAQPMQPRPVPQNFACGQLNGGAGIYSQRCW
jgi:hypothetical protein